MICKVSTGYSVYYSYVFARFNDGFKDTVVIFDENYEKLFVANVYENKPSLTRVIFIIDNDKSNWIVKEFIVGKFIKKKLIVKGEQWFLDSINNLYDINSEIILNKARKQNELITIDDWNLIENELHIENLLTAAWGFHDSYISHMSYKSIEKNELLIRFDGAWGCSIELLFEGDISIHYYFMNEFFCANIFIEDGYVYFVDEEINSVRNITDDYVYFRGNMLKWRIILEEEKDELD